MSPTIVADLETSRNLEARRRLARLEVYRRAGRQGRTKTRAFLVAVVAWRLGDTPPELVPAPADFDIPEGSGAGWCVVVNAWLAEALAEIGGEDA